MTCPVSPNESDVCWREYGFPDLSTISFHHFSLLLLSIILAEWLFLLGSSI